MGLKTLSELRSHISTTARELNINSTIDEFINTTLQEINDPAWAFEQTNPMRGYNHRWSFNRRKNTITTVASTEFYQLPRDLDEVFIIRQTDTPKKLRFYPDEIFYKAVPNPTATGNPRIYRLWEEEGISTRLTTADTITIVSSSTSDTTQKVSIVGYNANGFIQSEELSLNGTTTVNGTLTYAANMPIRISKSANTVGYITVKEASGATNLVILGQEERSPRFKVVGLYPIPDAAITLYLEYYTRIRRLVNDTDVPDIDDKWTWVIRLGGLAKVYQYQGKEGLFNTTQALYAAGVRTMVKSDIGNSDYNPMLARHGQQGEIVTYSDEGYGSYGLNF